jgi:hypothetical protein
VTNQGPGPLAIGEQYRLDRLERADWRAFPTGRAFTSIGYELSPGHMREFALAVPDAAPEGRYRVTKDVTAIGTPLSRRLAASFQIVV